MRYESGKDCTIRLRNGTEVLRGRTGFLHVTDKAEETRFLYGSFSGLVSFPTFFYIFAVTIYSFTLQQGPLRLTYSKPMTSSKPDRG